MSTQGKTDSDDTSFAASSPRRPLYFVQSPSGDSHDGEKTSMSLHSTPALSPMGSPPHSNSSLGRHSSSTRFSGSGKTSTNGGHHRKGEKPWKEFDKIEEEGLLEFDGARRRPSPRCYIIAFVVGFFLLFSLFSLILLCVSKSHKPTITMQVKYSILRKPISGFIFVHHLSSHLGFSFPWSWKQSIRFQQFSIQAGVDSSGVPTDMVSVNTIVKFKFRNTATFFGLHVTSTPLHLSFSQLNVATGMVRHPTPTSHDLKGKKFKSHFHFHLIIFYTLISVQMQKFYQPRNSHKTIKVTVRGSNIPLYGGGASLNISNGTVSGAVPLTLSFTVRSRGYVLGRLVRPKFYLRMKCPVAMDFGNPKKKVSIPLKDSCTYRRWNERAWASDMQPAITSESQMTGVFSFIFILTFI